MTLDSCPAETEREDQLSVGFRTVMPSEERMP